MGRSRPYLLHLPREVVPGLPLVVQLHGRGIEPLLFDRWTGYSGLADEAGFVLAMPRAVGAAWNDGRSRGRTGHGEGIDDVAYLVAVIDDLIEHRAVDAERVYLVGMSNGATMAGRLAWERPERLAAVAQVAGTLAVDLASGSAPSLPLPLLQIHGTRDRVAPYAGGRATGWMRLLVGRAPAGPSLPVDEWARLCVDRNGDEVEPETITLAPGVSVRRWRGHSPSSDLAFYRVEGGGHTWPGSRVWMPPHLGRVTRALDATRASWEFLSAHSR